MMLTKQERETIAKRLWSYDEQDYYEFYQALTGEETTKNTPLEEDCDKMANIIFDLCDTSNMIELPLDKDGKVINIGDKMCDASGRHLVVISIEYFDDCTSPIIICRNTKYNTFRYHSDSLVHDSKSIEQQ